MLQLWLIEYSSSRWSGASWYCTAYAKTAEEAESLAERHMTESMLDIYSDEDAEVEEDFQCPYSVIEVELLDELSEHWEYYTTDVTGYTYPSI